MLHTTQHINVFQYNIELISATDKEEDAFEQLLVTFSSYSLVLINNNENTTIS